MTTLLSKCFKTTKQWNQVYNTCRSKHQNQCGCPPPSDCVPPAPPTVCRPCDIPPNPCCPRFHGKDTYKKYKYLALFVGFPLIIVQGYIVSCHHTPPKGECRDYEYMRRRTKRFPWGDGTKSLFHNDETNHLPGECTPPEIDCD